MMQPLDIKTQKFQKGLLGYKAADVDNFIETVYRAYSDLFTENEKLNSNLEKLNATLQENRLKIFELEGMLRDGGASKETTVEEKKVEPKERPKEKPAASAQPKEEPKQNASSKFFKKDDEETVKASTVEDDEIFVGEIEDSRKPDRMMIGDGEEEDSDFEFL